MSREAVFSNANIVLDDEVLLGSVQLKDGVIADISQATGTPGATGEDFDGDYLMPGLVELHTDHLESHFQPRPGTHWDPIPAVLSHDAQVAGAGVTTVFDAVRIGAMGGQDDNADNAGVMIAAVSHAAGAGILRAEHFVHLRCEVAAPDTVAEFDGLGDVPVVRLASLMDHTPGQRQYADVEAFRRYMVGKGRVSAADIEALMAERRAVAEEYSDQNRRAIAERANSRGIILAAHDDATVEHVDEAHRYGVRIAEFPTTEVAASRARDLGQLIVLGAPNIVRGGSQSGNVAASDMLAKGLLDILSSDYVPFSPLQAVFRAEADGIVSLPEAVRLVAANPARAVGFEDRGRIETGLRADLVRVHAHRDAPATHHPAGVPVPVVKGVWRSAQRVA